MEHRTQVALLHRLFALIDGGGTQLSDACWLQSTDAYISTARLAWEREYLFARHPLLVTHASSLVKPGDYVTDDLGFVPLLLTRDEEGRLQAFANLCRHRGARLARGCGHDARAFVCPYHGWCYDLQGQLRNLVPRDGFAGLHRREQGLMRLAVFERHGLVWVVPKTGASIDETRWFGELDAELAAYGFAGFSHFETRVLHARTNWKLVIDGFLESWHFNVLHRQTIAPLFLPGLGLVDGFGPHLRVIYPRRSVLQLRGRPESEWDLLKHSVVIYVLFPNTLVNWQGDHLEIWRVFPGKNGVPGECVAEASLYTPTPALTDSAREHWRRNMDLLIRTVVDEDLAVAEDMQRGYEAHVQTQVTFGRHEPALALYHAQLGDESLVQDVPGNAIPA
jgi:phenylpropionate dioxygenase-like ring-hydroxylating dioxygenase large terminal subunit